MEPQNPETKTEINEPEVKLLVVDDRLDNLLSIEAILAQDGYNIVKAESGRAALKILMKQHDFTMILMDVQMPNLNGFDTAEMIYEWDKLKHIPIIFITANDHGEKHVFKGYQTGAVDYIHKPINPELLRAKVAVFVELFKKNHKLLAHEQNLIQANKNLEREIQEHRASEEKVRILNEQLLDNINQLRATNEELERFAYVASHDLQEPLRKIILFGGRLDAKYKDQLGEDGRICIERMTKATERMQVLIHNILNFSRSAAATEMFEEVNLNRLMTEVLGDLEVFVEQKNATIDVGEFPTLTVIPSQFRQLMQNLLINSLKFSKENVAPEIHIYAEKIKGMQIPGIRNELYDDDYCNIYVKDNGIGFEQHYADQIFMSFKRLHSFERFEGSGLGLSICKKIVEKHKGFITATGKLDEGATFIISLPMKKEIDVIAPNQSANGLVERQRIS